MKNIPEIVAKTQKIVSDNSPTILTAIGVVGTLSTAYLSIKATFRASAILDDVTYDGHLNARKKLDNKDKFLLLWKLYIPATGSALLTVGAIIGANRVGTRRAAAMAAAYTISERAYSEYKEKVVEQIGKNKEQKVRDEIAQDRVRARPVGSEQVIITGGGDILCMDAYTGRYFQSSMEAMKQAQNNFNHKLLVNDSASLTEFYSMIGLSNTKVSDNVGWRSDKMMELYFSTTIADDGRPCLVLDFIPPPSAAAFRSH